MNFEVNKSGFTIDGSVIAVGTVVTLSQIGKNWRSLLSAGIIRRVNQNKRRAFTDSQRFKLISRLSYS